MHHISRKRDVEVWVEALRLFGTAHFPDTHYIRMLSRELGKRLVHSLVNQSFVFGFFSLKSYVSLELSNMIIRKFEIIVEIRYLRKYPV